MRKQFMFLLALLAVLCAPALVQAAEFPSRPVKIIVPFAAGGETDLVARIVAQSMTKNLGQRVVVQNVVGALGLTGINEIVKSKADGYTLGIIPTAPLTIFPHTRDLPYTLDSFEYIGRAVVMPYFLVTNAESFWNTVPELVKAVKAEPGKYFYAGNGQNSLPHLAAAAFLQSSGLNMKLIQLSSPADTAHAMASNRVQIYAAAYNYIQQFDVKPLAVLAAERSGALPDVPAIKEFGFESYGTQFLVLTAPKGVDKKVVAKLNASLKAALEDKAVRDELAKMSIQTGYLNAEDTLKYIDSVSEQNKKFIE